MDRVWKETFLMHSRTKEFEEKVLESRRIVREVLIAYKSYIAYSGGKDSLAMLHLIIKEDPSVRELHWDYGRYYVPRWLEREIIRNAKALGADIEVRTSLEYEIKKREAIGVLGREFIGSVGREMMERGFECVFLGLRSEESSRRNIRTKKHIKRKEMIECYPIARWSWKDVWAYIVSNNISYPSIYDKYSKIYGWDKVRLVTFFDPEFDKFGSSNVDGVLMPEFRFGP